MSGIDGAGVILVGASSKQQLVLPSDPRYAVARLGEWA